MVRRAPLQGSGFPESRPRRPLGPPPAGPRRLTDAARGVSSAWRPRGATRSTERRPSGWLGALLPPRSPQELPLEQGPHPPRRVPTSRQPPGAASPGTETAFPPLWSSCHPEPATQKPFHTIQVWSLQIQHRRLCKTQLPKEIRDKGHWMKLLGPKSPSQSPFSVFRGVIVKECAGQGYF